MILRKVLCLFLGAVLACVAGTGIYLWSTYISDSVSEGSAYGFTIGETKRQVFDAAAGALRRANPGDSRIFIQQRVSGAAAASWGVSDGFNLMHETLLRESSFGILSKRDRWTFFFSASMNDTLSLKFCGEVLCNIYRHRQRFEIP